MNIHGGYHGDRKEMTDLSININPFGPPKDLKRGMEEVFSSLGRYPSIDGREYEKGLKERFLIEGEVILGNGAMELIYLFARAFKGGRALIIQPTFNEYQRAFTLAGVEVSHFYFQEEEDFQLNLKKLERHIEKEAPDLLILCHPNNPTGTMQGDQTLIDLCVLLERRSIPLMLDGSFVDFLEGGWQRVPKVVRSYLSRKGMGICSLTKFYGIPGIRLGYAFGAPKLIGDMRKIKEPWTMNRFAFYALEWILKDRSFERETWEWMKREGLWLKEALKKVKGIRAYPSGANFTLIRILEETEESLQSSLLEKGIYIRSCTDFNGLDHRYYRFALGKRGENEKIIRALQEALKGGNRP